MREWRAKVSHGTKEVNMGILINIHSAEVEIGKLTERNQNVFD
jgi:hypothetical protein